jgi:glycosyltransferase involved in cell wall biosynthesis
MKLTLVTRRYPPLIGGAEKVFSYLAAALAAEGAEVTVLTAQSPGSPSPEETGSTPVSSSSAQAGLTVVRLPTSSLRFAGTLLYMAGLRRWFARHRTDLAYVSMLKHDAYVTVGAGRRLGFPVVLRPEGAGATGDLAWQRWGRFGRTIGRRCHEADAVVSISSAITEELHRDGYDPARIHEIPNGVPMPDPVWQPRSDWRSSPVAVFVGRLAPEKGLATLVQAWPLVLQEHPHARLVLVGEGPERSALGAQVARLNLERSITLPGASNDPNARLRQADLFVLPSREEGMSIALLEAMALGIPVVATSIPGNRRLIDDWQHGRLVPPDDPAALARAIREQWSGFEHAVTMGTTARLRVEREFSIAAVARTHLNLFRQLCAAKGR